MKISELSVVVDEITDAGRRLRGELDVAWVAPSLLSPYTATGPLAVQLDLTRVDEAVLVQGRCAVELAFECVRTLTPSTITLDLAVSELFEKGERSGLDLDEGIDSDDLDGDEPWIIEEGRIELEPLLRETLVLAQDPYPVVHAAADSDTGPLWSSDPDDIDPRWAALKDIELT